MGGKPVSRLLILTAPVVILAAIAVTVATTQHGSAAVARAHHYQTTVPPVARLQGTDVWPAGARPAPDFAERDQAGRLITRASLRGKVWAITFIDSRCTKQCPVEAHALGYVQRQLGPRYPLQIIVVSVLPQWDTPARVRAFAHKEGLIGEWHWLLGAKQELAPVWQAYGIWVVTGIVHTSAVYLVDTHGDVRVADGVSFLPSQLVSSVRALTR